MVQCWIDEFRKWRWSKGESFPVPSHDEMVTQLVDWLGIMACCTLNLRAKCQRQKSRVK